MTGKKTKKQTEATPKGAVEVDEKDLDQAAGGVLIGLLQPADSLSLNYAKVEFQKVAPTTLTSAGPGAGPHVAPEVKI